MIFDIGMQYFNEKAKQLAKETGEACPLWCDTEFRHALFEQDKKYGTSKEQQYLDLCHDIEVFIECDNFKVNLRCTAY